MEKVFTADVSTTKTYIDGSTTDAGRVIIKWCADDAISVWDGFANRKFTMVEEPDGASATFKGMVDKNATDFYAIYPYSTELKHTHVNSTDTEVFSIPKSNVQFANPEGGLADGAAFACGKVTQDGKITFEPRSALLKFRLAEGMDVKSLTIEGNEEDDILAGTANFSYSESDNKNFTPGFTQSAQKYKKLTFCNEDGSNLLTGVDYYIGFVGNEFKKGYTVSLTLSDDKVLTRTSNKDIHFVSSYIYPLAGKPLSKGLFDYYEGYLAGEDIMIAGKVYNKTTHPNANLITTATEITAAGVYFIAPNVDNVKYAATSSIKGIVLIGQKVDQRSKLTQSANIQMTNQYGATLMNLDITNNLPSGKYMFNAYVSSSSSNKATEYRIDNCRYIGYDRAYIYYRASDCYPADIVIHNSDFQFTNTGDIWLFNANTAEANINSIDFQNNVFWHSSTFPSDKGFRFTNGSSIKLGKLVFRNNIFYNLTTRDKSSTYFSALIQQAEVFGNLFYMKSQPVNGDLLQQDCNDVADGDNYYYTEAGKNFGSLFTVIDSSPFTSFDVTTGEFVKADAYKNYGAKR